MDSRVRRAAGDPLAQTGARRSAALRRVRSTLICSGLTELRQRGAFDEYVARLSPGPREVILAAVAGVWLPADVALEHFRAVDALGLTADEAFAIGAGSGRRIQQSVLSTLVRLAAGAGANPWTVFQNYERLWSRIFDGGTFHIDRLGPKEVRVDYASLPPCRYAYFRNAFRGANDAGLRLFSRVLYVRELTACASDDGMALRVSWV